MITRYTKIKAAKILHTAQQYNSNMRTTPAHYHHGDNASTETKRVQHQHHRDNASTPTPRHQHGYHAISTTGTRLALGAVGVAAHGGARGLWRLGGRNGWAAVRAHFISPAWPLRRAMMMM